MKMWDELTEEEVAEVREWEALLAEHDDDVWAAYDVWRERHPLHGEDT